MRLHESLHLFVQASTFAMTPTRPLTGAFHTCHHRCSTSKVFMLALGLCRTANSRAPTNQKITVTFHARPNNNTLCTSRYCCPLPCSSVCSDNPRPQVPCAQNSQPALVKTLTACAPHDFCTSAQLCNLSTLGKCIWDTQGPQCLRVMFLNTSAQLCHMSPLNQLVEAHMDNV